MFAHVKFPIKEIYEDVDPPRDICNFPKSNISNLSCEIRRETRILSSRADHVADSGEMINANQGLN